MRGRKLPIHLAASAAGLKDVGFSQGAIAGMLKVPKQTISDILNRHGRWEEITHNDTLFNEYRKEARRLIHTGSVELIQQCLEQIEKRLPDASAAQSAVVLGILRQHERLDSGEATQNIAVIHHHSEAESLDRAAEKLARSLLRFSNNEQRGFLIEDQS